MGKLSPKPDCSPKRVEKTPFEPRDSDEDDDNLSVIDRNVHAWMHKDEVFYQSRYRVAGVGETYACGVGGVGGVFGRVDGSPG